MSVTAVLPYSSIYSWLLNSCMPHFPTFFFFPGFFPNTWQLPDVLSSAPILEQLLLLLQPASHTQSTPSKGERGASDTFSSVLPHLCPPPFAQEHPKQFYFHFSISIFGVLKEKKKYIVTCTSPLPLLFFFALCPLFPCKGAVLCANCILSSMLLCLHTKGSSGRFPPHCPDSCCFGSFTCVVLHMKDLIKHILRLHSKTDVRSQNIYLSSVLDKAQLSAYFRISHHSEMSS